MATCGTAFLRRTILVDGRQSCRETLLARFACEGPIFAQHWIHRRRCGATVESWVLVLYGFADEASYVERDAENKGVVKGAGMRLARYWSDPTWRMLRITTIVTASSTLVILAAYFLVSRSLLYPLAAAVVINIVANLALVVSTLIVRTRK